MFILEGDVCVGYVNNGANWNKDRLVGRNINIWSRIVIDSAYIAV